VATASAQAFSPSDTFIWDTLLAPVVQGTAAGQGEVTGVVPMAVKKALQSGRVSQRPGGEVKPLELEGEGA